MTMWSKISNSKAAYMVLAIVCSIALWLYVDIVEAPKRTQTAIRRRQISWII